MGDQPVSPGTPGLIQIQDSASTASHTLSFIQGVDQLFGNPISSGLGARRRRADRRIFLGAWHDFLYDDQADIYYTPVLEKVSFWDYLVRSQGILRPKGECKATAAWAKLLYGLGITPNDGIVTRTLGISSPEANRNADIRLELSGETICHIINLYGKPGDSARVISKPNEAKKETWPTDLGDFRMAKNNNSGQLVGVTYRGASDSALSLRKRPFLSSSKGIETVHLDNVMPMYELALNLGTSDFTLAWPERSLPLPTRMNAVLATFERLNSEKPTASFVLVTRLWLEEPGRILCRAALSGGTDDSFLRDILGKVDKKTVPLGWRNDDEFEQFKARFEDYIRGKFCDPGFTYTFRHRHYDFSFGPSPKAYYTSTDRALLNIMRTVLKEYGREGVGSWKETLHLNAAAVCDLILWHHEETRDRESIIDVDCICPLELDRSTVLWTMTGLHLDQEAGLR